MFDLFITPWKQVIERCFYDPANAPEYQRLFGGEFQEFGGAREAGRTMSIRMCFRPFMYDPALPGMLGKVQTPTLIVWGDRDTFCSRADQAALLRGIRGSRLAVYQGAGHALHWEQPARFVDDLLAFLKS